MIAPRLDWLLPEPIPTPPALPGFDAPVATLLARRGIGDPAALRTFLASDRSAMHPVTLMADAEAALARIELAVERGERLAIWGDYDADGMSAVAVWVLALRVFGADPARYVPSRWSEGYGLSRVGLEALRADGVRLVVTCDCGVGNVEEVEIARQLGIDVVVTDHHLPGPVLPRAVAVVDPHRSDCNYPDPDLTGAGVAYKLAAELAARRGVEVPDLAAVAAIGTVADLAPMTGESRAIVRLGLAELRATRRAGLRALLRKAADDPEAATARDLSFGIAPRVNAAGRIAEAELAISLLVEEEPVAAERLADELETVHERRRELTTQAIGEARALVAEAASGNGPLVVRNDAWSPGLIGLIAGRLADALVRPVAVVSAAGAELRGSVRATEDFHVAAALEACAAHLTKRGGHQGAGGFSLVPEAWDRFVAAFEALERPFPVGLGAGASAAGLSSAGALRVDLVLAARHLTWELARQIERLAPFGPANELPVLAVTGMQVTEARRVGPTEAHIAFRMRRGLETFDAVAFGSPADRELPEPGSGVDLVGSLERDTFQGVERLRLRVLDFAHTGASPLLARRQPRVPLTVDAPAVPAALPAGA